MIYAGIDIGKNEHGFAVVRDRDNNFVKPCMITNDREGLSYALSVLKEHEPDPEAIVIGMEATGHYWRAAAHFFRENGCRVDVFNSIVSAKREQQNVRGCKSDKSSAVAIAKVVRDDDYSTHDERDSDSETVKAVLRQRANLVEFSTGIAHRITGYWDVYFPELQRHLTNDQMTTKAGLRVLEKFSCAHEIAQAHLTTLKHAFRGIADESKVREIRDEARNSIGLRTGATHSAVLSDVRMYRNAQSEISLLDKELKGLETPGSALLKTIPGVGTLTSAYFIAAIGDLDSFAGKSSKPLHSRILAFAGAEPRTRSSGKFTGKVRMSKRGDRELRRLLFLAADSARRCCPHFKAIYEKQKQKGKHHKVALSHVARKIVVVATAMLKKKEEFSLEKLSKLEVECL